MAHRSTTTGLLNLKLRNSQLEKLIGLFELEEQTRRQLIAKILPALRKMTAPKYQDSLSSNWLYVPAMPSSSGLIGRCVTLQLGNSNHFFEVALYQFTNSANDICDRQPIDRRVFILTPGIRRAKMNLFCDFVGSCVRRLLAENGVACPLNGQPIHMGVALGFQLVVAAQRSPTKAWVLATNKDFRMSGLIKGDFAAELRGAFKRESINVKIVTVLNDTVSVLLGGIHTVSQSSDVDCSIGLLCSKTGSNIAYVETDADFLEYCNPDGQHLLRKPFSRENCLIVNTEAGYTIGDNCQLRELANVFEKQLADDLNQQFRLECVISATWYVRILERCVIALIGSRTGAAKDSLPRTNADKVDWRIDLSKGFEVFTRCDKCFADLANGKDRDSLLKSLTSDLRWLLDIAHLSDKDAELIASFCQAIVGRTAAVAACSVAAVAEKIYNDAFPGRIGVAIGGNLFTSISQLQPMLESELRKLLPSTTEIQLIESQPLLGCAVTAVSACQLQEEYERRKGIL